MKKIIFSLLLMTTFLTGCTSINNDFDCPKSSPVICKSLDEVNDMVDYGQLS